MCALCHGADGSGYGAPASTALANPNFLAIADETYLFENTARGRPGTRMSAWGESLSDAQIRAIVGYIREWRTKPFVDVSDVTVEGDVARGAMLYEENCAVCHGEDGGGLDESSRAPNGAPSLNNPVFLDTASDGFIRYSIAEGRPGTSMEAYAGVLTDQEIDDLVAFIRSWQK
jgi:cytochrome c oxidase cbb3-type subunit 3/ubiquinol-cytochrome c reductase cytochrome c subunit